MVKFQLTQEEEQKYKEWALTHKCKFRTEDASGVHKFSFVPTNYGTIAIVECQCGAEFHLTNYDKWRDD